MVHKTAILIDGGFFVQRFKAIHSRGPRIADLDGFVQELRNKVKVASDPNVGQFLHRIFYYDCKPFGEIKKDPNGQAVDFAAHPQFKAANAFHNDLKSYPQLALRLGELSFDGWKIHQGKPGIFIPDFKQKSVDIKLGLDIAWLSSKRIVDSIVLIAGDSDFVSPMKFARREGLLVYLHVMQQAQIKSSLKEHADFII